MAKNTPSQEFDAIPPATTAAYAAACELGRQHAAQFAQSLKDKPYMAGANQLGRLASRMNLADESPSKGFAVGFFSYLERLISLGAHQLDVAADAAHVNSIYASTQISE